MGAAMLREPDIEITQDEAALLAEALKEVAGAYDFTAMLNPRTQAWIDLGIACTTVYGLRVLKIARKQKGPRIVTMQSPQQETNTAQ